MVGTYVLVREMKSFLNLRGFSCYKIVKIAKQNNLHKKLRAFRSQTTGVRISFQGFLKRTFFIDWLNEKN